MSEAWERDRWRLDEARSRRLPQVEDLPHAGDGYDRAAVEAAFESFYRHAAQMDRTLEVLESVAAFQREAGALRADIRALRAASWGPVPTLRHTVATTAVGRVERGGGPFHAWPRIALYSAFIIFVAVGSAVADLSSGAIVALVVASWLVVGVAELAVSGLAGRFRRAPRGYPAWERAEEAEVELPAEVAPVAVEPEAEQPVATVPASSQEPAEDAADEADEAEPEEAKAWRPWARPEEAEAPEAEAEPQEGQPAAEPVAAEPVAAPAPVAEPDQPDEPEVVVEDEPEFVPAAEPFGQPPEAPRQPLGIVPEVEPLEEAEQAEPEPVESLADAEPEPAPEPVAPAAVEQQPRRLRFWRRRPAEVEESAALEPLPEPRHVRLVGVDEPGAEPVAAAAPEPEADPEPEVEPEPEAEARTEPEAVAQAEPEPQTDAELEPQAEAEPQPLDEETAERPAVALVPGPLRLRRGRR